MSRGIGRLMHWLVFLHVRRSIEFVETAVKMKQMLSYLHKLGIVDEPKQVNGSYRVVLVDEDKIRALIELTRMFRVKTRSLRRWERNGW